MAGCDRLEPETRPGREDALQQAFRVEIGGSPAQREVHGVGSPMPSGGPDGRPGHDPVPALQVWVT